MFCKNAKSKPTEPCTFENEPCLINPQYQHRTLGEMVAMFKLSGEFPSVGMRNGVYYASDIDAEIPTTRDKFVDIDILRSNIDETEKVERQTREKLDKATAEQREAELKELEQLRKLQKENANAQPTQK